jgi:hypothetical protein
MWPPPGKGSGAAVRMRARTLAVAGLIAVAGICILFHPARSLDVSSRRTGKVLWRVPVATGEVFTFAYIHSIELTPVEGRFAVEADGWLRLVETRFPSYGAGLPAQVTGRAADGWMVAASGERMPEFSFYMEPINRARLRVGERTLDLSARLRPGDVVAIAAGHYPYLLLHRDPF